MSLWIEKLSSEINVQLGKLEKIVSVLTYFTVPACGLVGGYVYSKGYDVEPESLIYMTVLPAITSLGTLVGYKNAKFAADLANSYHHSVEDLKDLDEETKKDYENSSMYVFREMLKGFAIGGILGAGGSFSAGLGTYYVLSF